MPLNERFVLYCIAWSRAYSNGAVQPIFAIQKAECAVLASCKLCSPKYVLWTFTLKSTTRVILSSAASAAVVGGSWQLVYPTLQPLTQFPGIQVQRKPVTHLSISSIFGSEANTGLRLPRSVKASAAPVVDCWSSDSDKRQRQRRTKY